MAGKGQRCYIFISQTGFITRQKRYIATKNSLNRRLLQEALVEGNPPSHSDLKMTSRGPGEPPHKNLKIFCVFPYKKKQDCKRLAPWAREIIYLDYNWRERSYGVPRPHADQSF
ncbi:hypothetical protein E2C01_102454 [Portunus trituberculatus]|uniref:Uncharacterized protein n=1 Tax=Portunus trituberculatus TaxID=210409 RepID=A0A5B7KHC6_PORTR|nr:hypothetical protein [Portunus trituberculatus]